MLLQPQQPWDASGKEKRLVAVGGRWMETQKDKRLDAHGSTAVPGHVTCIPFQNSYIQILLTMLLTISSTCVEATPCEGINRCHSAMHQKLFTINHISLVAKEGRRWAPGCITGRGS